MHHNKNLNPQNPTAEGKQLLLIRNYILQQYYILKNTVHDWNIIKPNDILMPSK